MYKLQNNVMIVSGAKNYCIYDLNSRKMYNMNSEYLKYLNELIADNADSDSKKSIQHKNEKNTKFDDKNTLHSSRELRILSFC